jgi:hypothetical protein
MIFSVMKFRFLAACASTACILPVGLALCCATAASGQRKAPQPQKPMAGPRATPLQITIIYITPSTNAQKIDKVQIGREMVVAEKSGAWMRIYANTDITEIHNDRDTPMVGAENDSPPPISGWIQAKGVVVEDSANGDVVLMGAAANEESLAEDPRGPANAAKSARLLYRRVIEMFPNSPLVPEAAWRAADIQWQLQKADASSLPSSKEQKPYMRDLMDEDDLKKVVRLYPRTRWAALAAFDLIDNRLCGNWQGTIQCPEKEADVYEKYADEYPDGPRTAQALYQATYRMAVLVDMYTSEGSEGKSKDAHNHARDLAAKLKAHFADSEYSWRAGALVYKLDEGIPVYGIDLN